jgi:hypothetical protein
MQANEPSCKRLKTTAKPLLFDLSPSSIGTEGDRKPLFILAILAARYTPVTVLLEMKERDSCITKYAEYLGVTSNLTLVDRKSITREDLPIQDYLQKIEDLRSRYVYFHLCFLFIHSHFVRFFSIAAGSPTWMYSNKCDLMLDFGDNRGPNRFVTKLLTDESKCVSFASLCLPMDGSPMWSNSLYVTRLENFCAARRLEHRNIMLLAGSMCPTFDFKQVLQWVSDHKEWSFIIIGELDNIAPRYYASKELMAKYILTPNDSVLHFDFLEYEDVLRFVDFSVCNGGAGSVYGALAAGVPQSVAFVFPNINGNDKHSNCRLLQALNVGPITTKETIIYNNKKPSMIVRFEKFMQDVTNNLPEYAANAVIYKQICKQEFQEFDQGLEASIAVLTSLQGQLNCKRQNEDDNDSGDLVSLQRNFGIFPKSVN